MFKFMKRKEEAQKPIKEQIRDRLLKDAQGREGEYERDVYTRSANLIVDEAYDQMDEPENLSGLIGAWNSLLAYNLMALEESLNEDLPEEVPEEDAMHWRGLQVFDAEARRWTINEVFLMYAHVYYDKGSEIVAAVMAHHDIDVMTSTFEGFQVAQEAHTATKH